MLKLLRTCHRKSRVKGSEKPAMGGLSTPGRKLGDVFKELDSGSGPE